MNSKTIILFLQMVLFSAITSAQQIFSFVHFTDTHIGNPIADEDLRRSIKDINENKDIAFVLISGDITEFGSDAELHLAKRMLDSLQKPWYIIPGNHDDNWSESGTNSFKKIFGEETFSFVYGGYFFLGTNCGPNMRMGPGQIPHENLVWMDSVLQHLPNKDMPVIFVNHYPLDSSLNNWYQAIDILKKYNIQLILCGHGHANHRLTFEGIPGVMGRSNLRAKDSIGGYNIVTFTNDSVLYSERKPFQQTQKPWTTVMLQNHQLLKDINLYPRPSYTENKQYPKVKMLWEYQDLSDIGCGIALSGNLIITADTRGEIFALNANTGNRAWSFKTGGKIYSSPAVLDNLVVEASTDGNIYCLQAATGKLLWLYKTNKPIVASPLIRDGMVFIGSSEGHFRALSLLSGILQWDFDQVKGFVVCRPLFYQDKLYFGSWGNEFYALNSKDGKLAWKWDNGATNRMFSPASCIPVATNGKVFIVAPDRYMTILDATNGTLLGRKHWDSAWVRESIGLSADSSLVYVKTMQGNVLGISTISNMPKITWRAALNFGYELNPAAISESNNCVYALSDKGCVASINRPTGKLLWKFKVSNCLVNAVIPYGEKSIIISTMDGKVTCLTIPTN
jgi:outer membrane protein assembly factor BamB/predicted MPP superfamily phosphohydrolase